MAEVELEQIEFVALSQIQLRKLEQPRRYFDPEALKQLTESIRQHGILQPLLVRPMSGESGRYELVAGERRFRAAQTAGLQTVPVVIRHLSDIEAATLALVENLQRQDLNAIEETEGILSLLALNLQLTPEATTSLLMRMAKEAKGQTAQNVLGQAEIKTVTTVFDSLGLMSWESFVTSRLPLLNLPHDLQQAIQTQGLDYTKAIALSRLKDDKQRAILLQQVLEQDWSVRRIQAQIKKLRHSEPPAQPSLGLFTTSSEQFPSERTGVAIGDRGRDQASSHNAESTHISKVKILPYSPEFELAESLYPTDKSVGLLDLPKSPPLFSAGNIGDTKTDESDNSSARGEQAEAGGAGTNKTLNYKRPTTAWNTKDFKFAQPDIEPEPAQTVPFSLIVEPKATIASESSAEPKSAPSQQELHALPDEEPLYRQLNLFNQIETISRTVLDLLRRRRKPISDIKKQSRLEALLVELNQILVEKW